MTEVEILFREIYKPLVYYLMKMVCKEDAEDIAIDAIYKAANMSDKKNAQATTFTIAKNMALDKIKLSKAHQKSHREINYLMNEDTCDIETEMMEALILQGIYEAYTKLPIGARVVLKLYFLGLKTSEIAARLHINARTVLNQKSRAIKLIKEAVAQ